MIRLEIRWGLFLSSLTLLSKEGITVLLALDVNTEITPPFLREVGRDKK
jgi:hypothetical protein